MRPEPDDINAADLGTAFGMELSIEDARKSAVTVKAIGVDLDERTEEPAAPANPAKVQRQAA